MPSVESLVETGFGKARCKIQEVFGPKAWISPTGEIYERFFSHDPDIMYDLLDVRPSTVRDQDLILVYVGGVSWVLAPKDEPARWCQSWEESGLRIQGPLSVLASRISLGEPSYLEVLNNDGERIGYGVAREFTQDSTMVRVNPFIDSQGKTIRRDIYVEADRLGFRMRFPMNLFFSLKQIGL